MTVLYILDFGTVGGATKAFIDLVHQMIERGVTPIVVTGQYDQLNVQLETEGIKTIAAGHYTAIIPYNMSGGGIIMQFVKFIVRYLRLPSKYLFSEVKAILKVIKSIDVNSVDIIHTNSSRNTLGCFLSMIYKKPHIIHIREFGDKDFQCVKLNPFYYTLINNCSTKAISVSDAVKKYWINKGLEEDKIDRIYDGVYYKDIVEAKNHDKDTLRCIIAGGVVETKGQHLAVEAIGKLPDNIKNKVFLDIVGWFNKDYVARIIEIANQYNISHQICLCGAHQNIHSELYNYDIGLMCSKSEGFGLVTAEYMHAGLGVIASDSGSCPELIDHCINGLLFKSGDSLDLSHCIERFYNDRKLLEKCSFKSKEKARMLFTCELNAEQVFSVYNKIITKK